MTGFKKRKGSEAGRDMISKQMSLWGRAERQRCWNWHVAQFKIHHEFLQPLRETGQRETNWHAIFTIEPLCFIHLNIPLFYSPRSMEYRIPGNNTQKLEDPCVFKGWCGSQHFPDRLFMVRNPTPQAFQSFTLFVHVKMKWSFVSNNAHLMVTSSKPLEVDKAWRHVTLCKWPPAWLPRHSYHCVRVSKVWSRLSSQPITLHGRIHLKCKPGPWPHSWNFNYWWRQPWTWLSTRHGSWLEIKEQIGESSEGLY